MNPHTVRRIGRSALVTVVVTMKALSLVVGGKPVQIPSGAAGARMSPPTLAFNPETLR